MLDLLLAASLLAGPPAPPPRPEPGAAQPPRANLAQYFTPDDYPPSAMERRAEGVTRFRLRIDAQGRVTDCAITKSAGDAALDAATCAVILSRAHYAPARDSNGRAIAGTDVGRVTWRLPDDPPNPFGPLRAPLRFEITLAIGADGRRHCVATINGGRASIDREGVCALILGPLNDPGAGEIPPHSSIILSVALHLDGEAPPPRTQSYSGAPIFEGSARLVVAADGRVTDCRAGEVLAAGPVSNAGFLCAFPAFSWPTFPAAPAGTPPRHGTMRIDMHVRAGPDRDTT